MVRGINRQDIFESDGDFLRFMDILAAIKKIHNFGIIGYCLMSNHIHLLLNTGDASLALAMKQINVRYAVWFNKKYERCGHLFQDRFKSEPIKDDRHMLSVLRYIHNNPVKAGVSTVPGTYPWSSYKAYLADSRNGAIVDTETVLTMYGDDSAKNIAQFVAFSNGQTEETYVDVDIFMRITDSECMKIAKEKCGIDNLAALQGLPANLRGECIQELKCIGAGKRQISRVTGIPYGIVRKF